MWAHAALAAPDRITPLGNVVCAETCSLSFPCIAAWLEQHYGVLIASYHAEFLVVFLSRWKKHLALIRGSPCPPLKEMVSAADLMTWSIFIY